MMEKLYDKFDDLIYLFSYGEESDKERYETTWYNLYINQKSGKLISRYFVNRDPFSMRQGSVSAYDRAMTYEQMKSVLSRGDIKDGSKYESLNEDNWEEWLINNHLL